MTREQWAAKVNRDLTIDECAKIVEDYPGGGKQQVDIIKQALVAAIRKLKDEK